MKTLSSNVILAEMFLDVNSQIFQATPHWMTTWKLHMQNTLQVGKDKKKETAQKLLYIANSNCNRFINKFQANYMLSDKANKLLELNILGVGVNIGQV